MCGKMAWGLEHRKSIKDVELKGNVRQELVKLNRKVRQELVKLDEKNNH